MTSFQSADRGLLVLLCLLATAWGVLGWLDLPEQAYAGFDTDGHNVVSRVYPGSPSAQAGLQRGDLIRQVDGVALDQASTLARLPPGKAGDLRRLTVERGEESLALEITYAPFPPRTLLRLQVSFLTGLCYVLFPLLAFLRHPGDNTRLLVLMGFGLSLALMPAPLIADFSIRSLTTVITSLFALFGLVALVLFLLRFPHSRAWLGRPWARPLLFFPAFLLWLVLAYRVLFNPPLSSTLSVITPLLSGMILMLYLVSGLYLLLRNFSRCKREERKKLGMNGMLIASVVGILPTFVAQLINVFSPDTPLPGQDFYFISQALLPMFWARAAERRPTPVWSPGIQPSS